MNQSVLFPDLQEWNADAECVEFSAQVQGANIHCSIARESLQALSGEVLAPQDPELSAKATALFEEYRFDIEEEVETLIAQEVFDEHGRITL